MPIRAEVEGIGILEFPDGTDPAVIQRTVSQVVRGNHAKNAGAGGVGARSMGMGGSAGDRAAGTAANVLADVMRGGVDVIGGGAQLLSRSAHTIGMIPESNPGGFFAGPKDVEAQNTKARANIEEMTGSQDRPGFSPVRAASGAVLSMPMAPTKFLQAPTWIERATGAGASGAVAGGLQEVSIPDSNKDFWARKGMQTGLGFGAGAIAQPVAESVVKYAVGLVNKGADKGAAAIKNLSGANSTENLVNLARESLKRTGIDFDSLGEAAKVGLLEDISKALSFYSGVNPAALGRQAAFREEGFNPLRHWVSKDPSEFTALENLSHQPAGAPLKDRKNALDKFVMDRLSGMRGEQPIPGEVGAKGAADLKAHIAQQEGKTNVLYRTFQEIAPNVKGEPQRFVNDLWDGLEGEMVGASLPAGIRAIVNKISGGEIPLTPSTLYQLQKMANASRGADGSVNYSLGHLSRAIDREMDAIGKSIGGDANRTGEVLKMARGQHAKKMGELEESKMLSSVDEGKLAPEKFTDQMMGSSVRELASTWAKLGGEAKAAVRADVLDGLKRQAYGAATDESGKTAAQAMFMKAVNDPTTQQKLRIVLGDKGTQEVNRLALMLESAHLQPAGSAVNNSKTGGALIGAFSRAAEGMKAKGIPGGAAVNDSAMKGLAQAAQVVPPDALGRRSLVIDPLVEEMLKRRVGRYAGLLGGASAYPLALEGLLNK